MNNRFPFIGHKINKRFNYGNIFFGELWQNKYFCFAKFNSIL